MIYETLKLVRTLIKDNKGLTAVEYAVLGGLIVGAIGIAAASFQGNLTNAFDAMFD